MRAARRAAGRGSGLAAVSSAPRHSHRDDGAGPAAAAGLAASGRLRDTRLCRRQAAGAPADSVAGRIRGVGGNPAAPYAALGRFLYSGALRRAARAEAGASRAFGGAGARFPMLFLLLDTDGRSSSAPPKRARLRPTAPYRRWCWCSRTTMPVRGRNRSLE